MATRVIRRSWKVDGVLTDPTTVKLSDPTGTYGVKRDDTDAVVVADGTAMTKVSTGVYEYSFTDIVGIEYTAYVEIVYDGATHHFEHDIAARAADAGLESDWDSLRKEVADFLGWTRDDSGWSSDEVTRLAAIIKSGLLQVYFPQRARPELSYTWSWMRPAATIETVAPYSTGTVTVVSGVVTLSGGTFPSWAADGELTVSGGTYAVDTRDDNTQVTLEDTSVDVDAGTTYTLSRPTYELPSTFGGSFDGNLHYKPGTNVLWPPVKIVSDQQIRRRRQDDTTADRPLYASVRPVTFDPTTGQRWEITFYPTPNNVYELQGRYTVVPTMLSAVNKYPLGGVAMSEVFVESCLAIAEQRLNDQVIGPHTKRFEALLEGAIANDAEAHAPDTLGYNADRSDGDAASRYDEHAGVAVHSFEGTTYYDANP